MIPILSIRFRTISRTGRFLESSTDHGDQGLPSSQAFRARRRIVCSRAIFGPIFSGGTTKSIFELRGWLAASWVLARKPRNPVKLDPENGDGRHVSRPPGTMVVPAVPLMRRMDMSQRRRGRALAGLALAVALTFASPAVAGAASRPAGLWRWMELLWTEGISGVWRVESPVPSRHGKAPASRTKQGVCVDPDGRCASLTGGQGPVCSRFNDEGACIDPNG